jgi:hypothetical protein
MDIARTVVVVNAYKAEKRNGPIGLRRLGHFGHADYLINPLRAGVD